MNIVETAQNLANYKKYLVVVCAIKEYLNTHNYLELDLPVLLPALIPESYLEVFETEFRYLDQRENLYLTPSPELLIKRLLVSGVGSSYFLGKSFRNSEPNSPKHTPEFTMLEFYKVGTNYMGLADEVLQLLQHIARKVNGKDDCKTVYQGYALDLSRWEKLTVAQAFEKYADISEVDLFDQKKFLEKAEQKKYTTEGFTYEDLFSQIYAAEIEPYLGCNGYPTLLYDYPTQFAALSKPSADGKTAERFEFYIAGVELGNCYSELADWKLQEARLKAESKLRLESGKIDHPLDWGFIDSLKKGLPDCAGIAIGVDRLAMIFANVESIDELKLISIR